MFVQTFYALPDMRLQFLYFCATFIRYIETPGAVEFVIPLAGDVPLPDEGDLDAAVHGGGRWEDALDEARERGWLSETHDTKELDPLATIARVTEHLPGKGGGKLRRALVGRHYRRLVDQYVLKLPSAPVASGALPAHHSGGLGVRRRSVSDRLDAHGALPGAPGGGGAAAARARGGCASPVGAGGARGGDLPGHQRLHAQPGAAAQRDDAGGAGAGGLRRCASAPRCAASCTRTASRRCLRGCTTRRPRGTSCCTTSAAARCFPSSCSPSCPSERPDALRVIISDTDFLSNVSSVANMKRLAEASAPLAVGGGVPGGAG